MQGSAMSPSQNAISHASPVFLGVLGLEVV